MPKTEHEANQAKETQDKANIDSLQSNHDQLE